MPFDSTPQVTPALALLRAARAKIEDPRNWVKHVPNDDESERGLVCAMSSVSYARSRYEPFLVYEALNALSTSLPDRRWNGDVAYFNDAPETTHADILALFDRAERRLMEGGA